MPESTEQILHPEKYTAGEAPVAVTLPADLATRLGTGWTVPLQDTFGEFQLGIWLREAGVAGGDATAAAAGWGGDRLAVVEGPDGAWGVVHRHGVGHRDGRRPSSRTPPTPPSRACPTRRHVAESTGKRVTILIASDEATLQALDGIFGATGVLTEAAAVGRPATSIRARRSRAAPGRWPA